MNSFAEFPEVTMTVISETSASEFPFDVPKFVSNALAGIAGRIFSAPWLKAAPERVSAEAFLGKASGSFSADADWIESECPESAFGIEVKRRVFFRPRQDGAVAGAEFVFRVPLGIESVPDALSMLEPFGGGDRDWRAGRGCRVAMDFGTAAASLGSESEFPRQTRFEELVSKACPPEVSEDLFRKLGEDERLRERLSDLGLDVSPFLWTGR